MSLQEPLYSGLYRIIRSRCGMQIKHIDIQKLFIKLIIMDIGDTILPEINIQTFDNYKAEKKFAKSLPSDGFVNKYDPQGQFIAIGCNDGQKILYSVPENKILEIVDDPNEIPVTCIRWRPLTHTQTKVIGVGSAEGHFEYWHIPSMKKMFSIEQKDNSILCCDFSKTGEHFATAGKDCNIRIYDEQTKSISTKLGNAEWNYSGHSNRIFSVKFFDQNTIISGGWDSVIHIWDLRQAKSVHSFYGPHIAGDSIDLKDHQILVGCYSSKAQIQLWDIRNQQQLQSITWPAEKEEVAYVFSACFGHTDRNTIVAGASGVNEVRLFSGEQKHSTSVRLYNLKHGCYTVDASYRRKQICFSTAKKGFFIYDYDS